MNDGKQTQVRIFQRSPAQQQQRHGLLALRLRPGQRKAPKQDGDARLAIALSPDGKQLISGGARWLDGEDRLPRIWQLPESVWPQAKKNGLSRQFEVDGQKLIGQWKSSDKEAKSWIASMEFKADGKLNVTTTSTV